MNQHEWTTMWAALRRTKPSPRTLLWLAEWLCRPNRRWDLVRPGPNAETLDRHEARFGKDPKLLWRQRWPLYPAILWARETRRVIGWKVCLYRARRFWRAQENARQCAEKLARRTKETV